MKLIIKRCLYIKKLSKVIINEDLFFPTKEVYGKKLINRLRILIFDISLNIINDEYLNLKELKDCERQPNYV